MMVWRSISAATATVCLTAAAAAATPPPDRLTLTDGSSIVGTITAFVCSTGTVTALSFAPAFSATTPLAIPIKSIDTVTLQDAMTLAQDGAARSPSPAEAAAVAAYPQSHALSDPAPALADRIDLAKALSRACAGLDDKTTWVFSGKAGASPSISTQSQNTANGTATLFIEPHPASAGFSHQRMTLELAGSYGTTKKEGQPAQKQTEWFSEWLEYAFNIDPEVTATHPAMTYLYVKASNYHNYSLGVSSERAAAIGIKRSLLPSGNVAVAADLRILQKNFFELAPSFTTLAAMLRESVFVPLGPVSFNETVEFYPTFASMDGREARINVGFAWSLTPTVSFDLTTTMDYIHDVPPNHKTFYLKPTASFAYKLGNR